MAKHKRAQSVDTEKSLKIDIPDNKEEKLKKKKSKRSLTPIEKKSFTFEVTEEKHKSPKKQKMTKQKSGINISLHEKNKEVNHRRHFCLCIITCGIWIPCWLGSCCCNCCPNPCDF